MSHRTEVQRTLIQPTAPRPGSQHRQHSEVETEDLPASDGHVGEQDIHTGTPARIGDGRVVFLAQVSGSKYKGRNGGENERTWSGGLKIRFAYISGVQIDRSHCRFIERIVVCVGDDTMRWDRSTGERMDTWYHYDASHDLIEKMEAEAVSE